LRQVEDAKPSQRSFCHVKFFLSAYIRRAAARPVRLASPHGFSAHADADANFALRDGRRNRDSCA
jgi:hypothetical protein